MIEATTALTTNVAPAVLIVDVSSGFMSEIVNTNGRLRAVLSCICRLDLINKYKMEEIKYVPLTKFQIEPTLDDKFWEEKVKRSIQDCNSISALKEIATLLARIATQRQGVIRGLVQDMFIFNNVAVEPEGLANPDVKL
jgi:hypothetical protein